MDTAAKKALFRAKLNAQKKRIDSPLVRYNEFDQPVCRVCDVVLKSEFQWDPHQASRKHQEAINSFKANAAARAQGINVKPEGVKQPSKPQNVSKAVLPDRKPGSSDQLSKPQTSSGLPLDFFDSKDTGKQKTDTVRSLDRDSSGKSGGSVQIKASESFTDHDGSPRVNHVVRKNTVHVSEPIHKPIEVGATEIMQTNGALPEGFFDNKDADLRARGIKPVKPDVKDEYKEFERLIKEDLVEVDNRLEEEEIDAAEMIEEAESVEQKSYREKVDILRKRKLELKAARSAKHSRSSEVAEKEHAEEDSSSDDDGDENFVVNWRAQHL